MKVSFWKSQQQMDRTAEHIEWQRRFNEKNIYLAASEMKLCYTPIDYLFSQNLRRNGVPETK